MIQAFSQERASRITGLTVRQLEYWDQTDVLKPSIASHDTRFLPRLYSYLDLVRLRVAKELRSRKMLPSQIRRMMRDLERIGFVEPLLTLRYVAVKGGKEVFWIDPRTNQPMSARAIEQQVQVFDLDLEDIRTGIQGKIAELLQREPGKIVRVRGLRGKVPVLDGTRIPTARIYALAESGWSPERIQLALPHITDVDVSSALEFERKRRTTAA
jgi:DNA-binding transcriptional MerR regulator